jgi:hypothetical protein
MPTPTVNIGVIEIVATEVSDYLAFIESILIPECGGEPFESPILDVRISVRVPATSVKRLDDSVVSE